MLVEPFEILKSRSREFLGRIGDFAGVAVTVPRFEPLNVSPSAFSVAFKRRVNRWVVRNTLNPTPSFEVKDINKRLLGICYAADPRIPDSLRKRSERRLKALARELVGTRYAESNALTAELTKLDLRSFGYLL